MDAISKEWIDMRVIKHDKDVLVDKCLTFDKIRTVFFYSFKQSSLI